MDTEFFAKHDCDVCPGAKNCPLKAVILEVRDFADTKPPEDLLRLCEHADSVLVEELLKAIATTGAGLAFLQEVARICTRHTRFVARASYLYGMAKEMDRVGEKLLRGGGHDQP